MSDRKKPVEHALVRSTVRVLAGKEGQEPTSVGTGLFYQVLNKESNNAKTVILTNKHVVQGADYAEFVLSFADSINDLNQQHQPVNRIDQKIKVSLINNKFDHPDPETDLCAIDITIVIGAVLQSGKQVRSMFLDSGWLMSQEDMENIRDIEPTLIIGYPKGIWDNHNNMPIARNGNTATNPLAQYQGKNNFLIDVSAFQGSSGSPVFSYESPMFRQPDGAYTPGTKVNLIGVVWGVIETTTEGELKVIEIPSALKHIPVFNSSLNLAIALHAKAIFELDQIILSGIQ